MAQEERDRQILAGRINGAEWNALAEKHDLSAERCRQICLVAVKEGRASNEQIRVRPRVAESIT